MVYWSTIRDACTPPACSLLVSHLERGDTETHTSPQEKMLSFVGRVFIIKSDFNCCWSWLGGKSKVTYYECTIRSLSTYVIYLSSGGSGSEEGGARMVTSSLNSPTVCPHCMPWSSKSEVWSIVCLRRRVFLDKTKDLCFTGLCDRSLLAASNTRDWGTERCITKTSHIRDCSWDKKWSRASWSSNCIEGISMCRWTGSYHKPASLRVRVHFQSTDKCLEHTSRNKKGE